jgi:hypothetical protein
MKKILMCVCLSGLLYSLSGVGEQLSQPDKKYNSYAAQVNNAIYGQDSPLSKSCAGIMKAGLIYDEHSKLSSRYSVQRFYEYVQQSDFQSASQMRDSSMKLGIPLEGFPAPLDLGVVFKSEDFKKSLQSWLSTAYSYLQDQSVYEEFSRVINSAMIGAIKSCIDNEKEVILKRLGTFVYVTPQDSYLRSFVVYVEVRPGSFDRRPTITSIEGSDFKCTLNGESLVFPYEVNTTTIALTCIKYTDESRVLSFNAEPSGASVPVFLPGVSEGLLLDLQQRAQGLAQAIEKEKAVNQQRFDNLGFDKSPELKMPMVGGGTKLWSAETSCPDGYYVSGIVAKDHDGGGFCYDCMSEVGVKCKPIHSK